MATAYQRLAREHPDYAWWRLPVAGVMGVFGYLMAILAIFFIAFIVAYAIGPDAVDALDRWGDRSTVSADDPALLTLDLLGLAVLIPVVLLSVLATGPRPVGYLSSVVGRIRWRWLGWTSLAAGIVYAGAILGSLPFSDGVSTPSALDGRIITTLAVIVLLVPFQAAAEEYVFRGYLMQLVGSWTRWAFVPVLVSVPVFALGHGYEFWGLVDVGVFGFTACILVLRTGGLEASIAAHTANNVVLFVLEALGIITASDGSGAGFLDVVPTILTSLVFIGVVEVLARRLRIERTREPLPPRAPARPAWAAQYGPAPTGAPTPTVAWGSGWYQPPAVWTQAGWRMPPPQWWQPPGRQPGGAQAPWADTTVPPAPAIAPGTPDYPGEIDDDWGLPRS